MKRTIEFRYWYPPSKRMTYSFTYSVDLSDRVTMQFTELYDINKKKIFEGDIVEYTKGSKQIKLIWYKNGAYRTMSSKNSSSKDHNILYTKKIYACGMKVIGNIYQNPELNINN